MLIERLILEFQTDDGVPPNEHRCFTIFKTLQDFVAAGIGADSPCAVIQVDLPRLIAGNCSNLAAGDVPETRSPTVATDPNLVPQRPLRSGSLRLQRVGEELQSQARNAAASDMVGSLDRLLEALSLREWDVLILMLKGCTCKEMGSELHIGLPTVAKHRARVLKKFGVRDHIELFQMLNNIVGRNLPRQVGLAAGGMQAIHRIDAADASQSDSGVESPEAKIHRRIEPNDLVRKQVTHRE